MTIGTQTLHPQGSEVSRLVWGLTTSTFYCHLLIRGF